MQRNSGIKKFLRIGGLYELLQLLAGRDIAIAKVLSTFEYHNASQAKWLDLGCGPGSLRAFIPAQIEYHGIDSEQNYIQMAKAKYPESSFYLGGIEELSILMPHGNKYDYVTSIGLFHHVDDAAMISCLTEVKKLCKSGAQILMYEPCYIKNQSFISRKLMQQDRGQCIRTYQQWVDMVQSVFPHTEHALCRFYRIPYIHIMTLSTI